MSLLDVICFNFLIFEIQFLFVWLYWKIHFYLMIENNFYASCINSKMLFISSENALIANLITFVPYNKGYAIMSANKYYVHYYSFRTGIWHRAELRRHNP